jgi:acetylornithine deacetylase/succinyl-diaminopimelate desuccinylase-like protein
MARIAPLLLSILFFTPTPALAADTTPDAHRQLVREIYAELVGIDTTEAHGSTTKAAEAVARRLKAAGFGEDDIHIRAPKPTKGNLVARLKGSGLRKPLLLLAHLDVVEAKREDWSVAPFELLERDGFFYGRGTLDDKAMAAIFTGIMIRMRREGLKPDRDVILALTADEEGGPDNGVDWLLKNHRNLVDSALVINEGGGGRMRGDRYLMNTVQAAEKTYVNFRLEVTNKGGHSSLPTRDNAIYHLANALVRIEGHAFPVELTEVTRGFFAAAAKIEGGDLGGSLQGLLAQPPDARAVERLSERPEYNALMRTTCVATMLDGGHAPNALPQSARANINCRVLPGHEPEEIRRTLEGVINDPQIKITETEPAVAAPASPLDPDLMQAVEKVTHSLWPGVPSVPTMSTGASDSRYFRNAGIPAYGVSGIFVDVEDIRAHGRDERLGVKQFYEGNTFLTRLVEELTSTAQEVAAQDQGR